MAVTENGEEIIDIPEEVINEEVTYTAEELEMFGKLGIDPETATTEDLKSLAKRVIKAESRVIADKKVEKSKETVSLDDARVRDILAESKFYDKNPEAEQYKDKIETLVKSNKLSREDALFLASKEDREIDSNREVYAKSNLG